MCADLRADLKRVERAYARTLELMAANIVSLDKHDYLRLREQAQIAEVAFEAACGRLEEHQRSHAGTSRRLALVN